MVKYICALLLVVAFAAPAFAQDVPQIEIAMGYGNVNVPGVVTGRHSGFTSHQTINLNSWLGIENFVGYYGLGTISGLGKTQMITDAFGGRFSYRAAKVTPYAVAGIGGSFLRFPQLGAGSSNSMTFRLGGGVDIPIGENFAWKVDVSRMTYHFSGYKSGTGISTGIVIKIAGQ